MMKQAKRLLGQGLLCIAASLTSAQVSVAASVSSGIAEEKKGIPASPAHQSIGERKFAQNCSRCHNAPEVFSPHISGTIIRHMRVRASLSKQDEKDILQFLNP